MTSEQSLESQAVALATRYAHGYLARDLPLLEQLLDDEWTLVTAGCGDKVSKKQQLDDLKSGKLRVESIEDSDVSVRTYGSVAVVSGVRRSKVFYNERDVSDLARFTQVYVAKGAALRCVSTQVTSLASVSVKAQVMALSTRYREAYLHRDASSLDDILDEDWTLITAGCGDEVKKKGQLEDLKSGKLEVAAIEDSDVSVRVFGDAAIVSGLRRSKVTYNKRDVSDLARYSQIYVPRRNGWRCVSTQVTSIRPDPDRSA